MLEQPAEKKNFYDCLAHLTYEIFMYVLWSLYCTILWSSSDAFSFLFTHRARAMVTQAASLSLSIFTHSDPWAKWNITQYRGADKYLARPGRVQSNSWFQTFAVFWIYYVFLWVVPQHLNYICWRFRTLYLFHLHRQVVYHLPVTPGNYPKENIIDTI